MVRKWKLEMGQRKGIVSKYISVLGKTQNRRRTIKLCFRPSSSRYSKTPLALVSVCPAESSTKMLQTWQVTRKFAPGPRVEFVETIARPPLSATHFISCSLPFKAAPVRLPYDSQSTGRWWQVSGLQQIRGMCDHRMFPEYGLVPAAPKKCFFSCL